MAAFDARAGADFRVELLAVLGQNQASSCVADITCDCLAEAFVGLSASVTADFTTEMVGDGFATPAPIDNAGPVIFDFGLMLSPHGSIVFPLEFDAGAGGADDEPPIRDMAFQASDSVNITGGVLADVTLLRITIDGGEF